MRARTPLVLALIVAALAGPIATARAADDDLTADSKLGAIMAVACGLSLKASLVAPVPYAGVAAVACMFAFLDAATSSDSTTGGGGTP